MKFFNNSWDDVLGDIFESDNFKSIIEKVGEDEKDFVWDYFRRLGTPFAEKPQMPFWHTLDEVINQFKRKEII